MKSLTFGSRLTFSWIRNMIDFSKHGGRINVDHLKKIQQENPIYDKIEKLKLCWAPYQVQDNKVAKNAFMRAVMKAFWGDYICLMFLNIFVTMLNLCGPFLIK